jgi:hypothetical protein
VSSANPVWKFICFVSTDNLQLTTFNRSIELIHRGAQPLAEDRLDCASHAVEHFIQHGKLCLAHR